MSKRDDQLLHHSCFLSRGAVAPPKGVGSRNFAELFEELLKHFEAWVPANMVEVRLTEAAIWAVIAALANGDDQTPFAGSFRSWSRTAAREVQCRWAYQTGGILHQRA
jgi:hypothetical protein